MGVHVCLACDRSDHRAVCSDDKRRSLGRQRTSTLDSELLGHRLVGIRQQGEVELVFFIKLSLTTNLVVAHSHDRGPEFCELGTQITEVLRLDRSTRRLGLDVEVQNGGTVSEQVAEADVGAVLIDEFELLDGISGGEHASTLGPSSCQRRTNPLRSTYTTKTTASGRSPRLVAHYGFVPEAPANDTEIWAEQDVDPRRAAHLAFLGRQRDETD